MKTIKTLLKKASDPYLAVPLLNGYRCPYSRIRTPVPVISSQLNPGCADMDNLKMTEQRYRQKQRQNYDRRHRVHDMPLLQPGSHEWVKDMSERDTVVSTAGTPRSYIMDTPSGTLRRNRYHLSSTSSTPVAPETHTSLPETPPENTVTDAVSPLVTPEVQSDSSAKTPECERR